MCVLEILSSRMFRSKVIRLKAESGIRESTHTLPSNKADVTRPVKVTIGGQPAMPRGRFSNSPITQLLETSYSLKNSKLETSYSLKNKRGL